MLNDFSYNGTLSTWIVDEVHMQFFRISFAIFSYIIEEPSVHFFGEYQYADSSLSKWNEIDCLYQTACESKQKWILAELNECHITKPAERHYSLKLLNAQYQSHIDTWQIEKEQPIKPHRLPTPTQRQPIIHRY